MIVFWDVAPCSLVVYRRFRAASNEQGVNSETSVKFYQTTRRNIPEDSHLTHRRENLKSHKPTHVKCVKGLKVLSQEFDSSRDYAFKSELTKI
jgi:hypothetical protein